MLSDSADAPDNNGHRSSTRTQKATNQLTTNDLISKDTVAIYHKNLFFCFFDCRRLEATTKGYKELSSSRFLEEDAIKAGLLLDKSEVVRVLREIVKSTGYDIEQVDLVKPSDSNLASGYMLRIKGRNLNLANQNIRDIAQVYNLRLKEENGLVIY